MKSNHQAVFTLMVDNEFGVLTRITALIRRAGWNIRSLAVAETAVAEISRLTICLECKHNTLEYVLERLSKLNCVRDVSIFSRESQVARELALARVKTADTARLAEFCAAYGAVTVSESALEKTLCLTLEPAAMDEALRELRPLGLLDVARSGTVALKLAEVVK